MSKRMELTQTDMVAIREGQKNYLTSKGASLYQDEDYLESVEYYRIAAAMGEIQAVSNLGYCYLYGRDIEANTSLAIAYFTIAANQGNIDAAYKLADIYGSDKWGVKDKELSVYYYNDAGSLLLGDDWGDGTAIVYCRQLQDYPSLCYALARETLPGGLMPTDLYVSYQFLKQAEKGYELALANGDSMYEESYNGVLELLKNSEYDVVRKEIDELFDEEY